MNRYKFKSAWAWPQHIEDYFRTVIKPLSIHLFNGSSKLGDITVDLHTKATIKADARFLPFKNGIAQSTFGDIPWNIPKHVRSKFMYEMRRITKIGGSLILNANWYPNHLRHCRRQQPILVSWPRMPFGNAAFILRYEKLEAEEAETKK